MYVKYRCQGTYEYDAQNGRSTDFLGVKYGCLGTHDVRTVSFGMMYGEG